MDGKKKKSGKEKSSRQNPEWTGLLFFERDGKLQSGHYPGLQYQACVRMPKGLKTAGKPLCRSMKN